MGSTETKEKILAAAEELFADLGFAATSMRKITTAAGVNLASVNYHFGTKEALIEAVFARRLEPLNRRRLAMLEEALREADGRAPSLERLVEAYVGPALRLSRDSGGAVFMRLFGHTLSQRDERIRQLFAEQFREVIAEFSRALALAVPGLPRSEIFWRMLFMVGAMSHTMALADKLEEMSDGLCDATDVEEAIGRLVPFLAAGMRAPAQSKRARDAR